MSLIRPALLAVLALTGCVGTSIRVRVIGEPGDALRVREAAAIWDLDVEITGGPAPITIEIRDGCEVRESDGKSVCGEYHGLGEPPCHKTLWSRRDVVTIAHELGHALGLDHGPEGTPMCESVACHGVDPTESQIEQARKRAGRYALCPDVSGGTGPWLDAEGSGEIE